MDPINAPAPTPHDDLLLRDEEIRGKMIILERDMRPLRAELEILSARFMQLWRAKNLIEKQLVPVKKISPKQVQPQAEVPKTVNPNQLLKQIQAMNPGQVLAIIATLQKGAAGDSIL